MSILASKILEKLGRARYSPWDYEPTSRVGGAIYEMAEHPADATRAYAEDVQSSPEAGHYGPVGFALGAGLGAGTGALVARRPGRGALIGGGVGLAATGLLSALQKSMSAKDRAEKMQLADRLLKDKGFAKRFAEAKTRDYADETRMQRDVYVESEGRRRAHVSNRFHDRMIYGD